MENIYYKYQDIYGSFVLKGVDKKDIERQLNDRLISVIFHSNLLGDIFLKDLIKFYDNSSLNSWEGEHQFEKIHFTTEYGKISLIELKHKISLNMKNGKINFEIDLTISGLFIKNFSLDFYFKPLKEAGYPIKILEKNKSKLSKMREQLKTSMLDYLNDTFHEKKNLLCFIHSKYTNSEAMINTSDFITMRMLGILDEISEAEFKKEVIKNEFK